MNKYLKRTAEFHNIYKSEIVPILRNYEVLRRRKVLKAIVLAVLSKSLFFSGTILLALVILFFINRKYGLLSVPPYYLVLFEEYIGAIFIYSVIAIITGYFLNKKLQAEIRRFITSLKKDCLGKILKVFGDISWYNNFTNVQDYNLEESGLFSEYNKRTIDDEFYGEYNGVSFRICETDLSYASYVPHRRGHAYTGVVLKVFKGVVISFKSNKKIKNRTIVQTKGDLTEKSGYWIVVAWCIPWLFVLFVWLLEGGMSAKTWMILLGIIVFALVFNWIRKDINKEKGSLDRVKLEDPRFEKNFEAYSSDQVEARYLLTTGFIERFQKLNTAFGTHKAKCSFFGNEIMFAISTKKNLFEIGSMFKSLNNPESINEFYNELSSIYQMIDYFKLDEKSKL